MWCIYNYVQYVTYIVNILMMIKPHYRGSETIWNVYALNRFISNCVYACSYTCMYIQLSGTRADIHGSLVFAGNKKSREIIGIAMYIISFSQLKLFEGASILFKNNSGT